MTGPRRIRRSVERDAGSFLPETLNSRIPGCEPLGQTHGLLCPSGSLHSFEHAFQRVFGGLLGVRQRNATRNFGTQELGTQLTLTQRNTATRYATDATLTHSVPGRRSFDCGKHRCHLVPSLWPSIVGEHACPFSPTQGALRQFRTGHPPRASRTSTFSLPPRSADTHAVPVAFRVWTHMTVTLWPRQGAKMTCGGNHLDMLRRRRMRSSQAVHASGFLVCSPRLLIISSA